MSEIKAIETAYKGYRFRSRLEARWAVYFDAVGLQWDYELQGFDLAGKGYLPDFWLPEVGLWAEVKPVTLTAGELDLVTRLVHGTDRGCLLLIGVPGPFSYSVAYDADKWDEGWPVAHQTSDGLRAVLIDAILDSSYLHEHRFYTNTGECDGTQGPFPADFSSDRIPEAIKAARSARFEHGESGVRR